MAIIRPECEADYPDVRRIHEQAFGRTAEAEVVEYLRPKMSTLLSLVALRRGQPVAHAFFTRVVIECESGYNRGVGLAPLAVLPEHQGTGLGTDLVRHGIAALKDRRHGVLVVLGEPAFYARFGFRPANTFGLKCSYDVPPECFLALPLDTGYCGGGGLVRYPAAFDDLG